MFTRAFDLTLHAEKFDEMLGALPAKFQAEMAAAQTAFAAARQDWRTSLGQEAQAAQARIRNAIGADAGRDTAVTLLIDHSGSMRREKRIVLAAAATDMACEFLLELGASVEILGFTTRNWKGGHSREQWRSSGSPPHPGRLCDLLHIIYRDAGDPRPPDLTPMLRPDVLKENIDGEAVEWAAGRLRARPEPHRILIVMSDGAPVDDSTLASNHSHILDSHICEVTGRLRQMPDLRIGAIGLGFDVSRYYPVSRTVRPLEELGRALIDLIEELVKPAIEPKPASEPKRPEGPRVPVQYRGPAMILTAEIETISSAALEQAIRRRAPQIRFGDTPAAEPTRPDQRPTALGSYPADVIEAFENGRTPLMCGVSYIPNIHLEGMDRQSYVTSCWWWPETREVVARTKAHAVTVMLGGIDTTPPKERILLEMQLVAAALDVLKSAIAVVWPDANAMWKPDTFRAELDRANGEIPHTLAVAVKIGSDTENLRPDGTPTWFARTEGLNAFGIMEVEWRAFDGEPLKLVNWMGGIAWYLINEGAIIGDGESMGSDAPGVMPHIVVRHEPSTTVLGTHAYVVYPQSLN